MKYLIISILTLSFTLAGCSDEWLNDIEPQGKLLEVNYYTTEAEMSTALVAVYNVFKNQYWQEAWSSWYLFGSLGSDDAIAVGDGRTDRPEFWAIHDYLVSPLNVGLAPVWNRCYYGIYRCNVVISRVDPTSDFGKIAIAEAKMLRAYFYFDLVRLFGEVPLIEKVLTPEEYDQAKVSKGEVFDFIVESLQEASVDLPVRWTGGDIYRMTKYAAHGLLGKVYVYMASPFNNLGSEYYDLAATELKNVIDNGGYALEADYDDVWWYANEFNNETLIEMSYGYFDAQVYWGNNGLPDGAETTANVIQHLCGVRDLTGSQSDTLVLGWGFDMVTQNLVDAYRLQGDSIRLHATTLAEWQLAEWGYTNVGDNDGYTGYWSKKRTTWRALNPDGVEWGWSNNERILRLADIYLLYAEALVATGDDAGARAAVDIVRSRAGLGSITEVEAAQSLSLLEAIKLERRLELAQEANRYYDLIRWNDAGAVLGPLGFRVGVNEHFPIPQSEINGSTLLEQNPAY
ncbi:MAG: RagB/SusD family nutrient uptake outer membrane protein [Salinivirgaceae bacterium]|jgi:hypothetical protein|nr:RagB/SusD family nutrient uptake outer membrane protein [Salinivirgaceae bacterium]